jgi:soluble lytic murein transglycosylase-like protein
MVATSAAVLAATAAAAAVSGAAVASPRHAPAAADSGRLMASYDTAAREYGVPASILLAIGYNESRWTPHGSMPSADGGYGLMDLTGRSFRTTSGRTGKQVTVKLVRTHYTLDAAAALLHESAATLKTSAAQNIRGAAAVLAHYARQLNGGRLPATLAGWYGAVAAYSGDTEQQTAELFAGDIFSTVKSGASVVTQAGQRMRLTADPGLHPDQAMISKLGLKQEPTSTKPAD